MARFFIPMLPIIALLACVSPDVPHTDDKAIKRDVEALLEEWATSISEGRIADFKALFSNRDGFAWAEEGEVRYRSADALAGGVDGLMATEATITNDVHGVVVTPLGPDAASFSADVVSTVVTPSFSFSFDGIVTGVAVREGGEWALLQGHLSEPPRR